MAGQGEQQQEGQPTTLGELISGTSRQPLVPENEWLTLVQAIAAGHEPALHALWNRMHRIVFTFIMRMTNNRETAEELTVDVFHGVWMRASTYPPDCGSVVGWIMNQARSRAIDRMRFEQRKKRVASQPEDLGEVERDPHEVVAAQDEGRLLRTALATLSLEERRAIETAFFSELTYVEAASQLDEPVGTVKTRIRSGLAKLRRALAEKDRS